jgi:DNA-binding NarL/FixJ family response regulator
MSSFVLQIIAEVEKTGPNSIPVTPLIWIGPIAFLGVFLLVKTWRRVARSKAHSDLSVQERIGRQSQKRDIYYDQMSELMAALADLSRQINGQIDTRLAKLEILLRQADEKIDILNQQKKQGTDKKQPSPPGQPGKDIKDIAEQFRQSIPPEKQENDKNLSPQARKVLEMFNQGISKIDIAQQLDRPVGEIELILSLAGKKQK